jgi:hypothetical protein
MSFPYLVSLLLFLAVLADNWAGGARFIATAAYRDAPTIALGVAVLGLLLWAWVLAASRRRETRFEGPVQEVRGRRGMLQPVLATLFIVSAANLAYTQTLPKLANLFVSRQVETVPFTLIGEVAPFRAGCARVPATAAAYGEVSLCLPEGTAALLQAGAGEVLLVTGSASWFGIEPRRYALEGGAPPARRAVSPEAPPRNKLDPS